MRLSVLSALILPWCLACASVNGVLLEPIPRGRSYRYAVPADSLAGAATRAFAAQGLSVVRDTVVGSTRLLVGSRGVSFMSWGELDRAAITPTAEGLEVRMISRPINTLDFLHQDRSPRLFQELARELGGTGVHPLEGDRVRLVISRPESSAVGATGTQRKKPSSDFWSVASLDSLSLRMGTPANGVALSERRGT